LRAGFRVADGLHLVEEIARLSPRPVFIMSYANLVFVRGVERFLGEAGQAGARGLIVPDLPVDADEGLYALGRRAGLAVVPVVPVGVRPERLRAAGATGAEYLYVALRPGITGAYTAIGEENLAFLRQAAAFGMKLIAGFGISSREQVEALAPHVHQVVAGSAFVREILNRGEGVGVYEAVRTRLRTLAGPA
jgi:tryptophan synthase alpha chain